MTSSQEPPGPKKRRRLAPDELARDIANRLKSSSGSHVAGRRFLPQFDLLNAGRLIMGFGALILGAALIAGVTWLSGLSDYETTGRVTAGSPAYACPGGPELGEVFEGEEVILIGRSLDRAWLVVRDERAPGNQAYVLESVVETDGDVTLLSTRECDPSDGQPVAAGESTTSASASGETSTTYLPTLPTSPGPTTGEPTTTSSGRPPRRNTPSPGTTTTTTTTPPP